ncbi:MAG: rare lipoprotein [Cyanobacteria bacterium RYN_339]|nr:rare lipoprotein [Cyanobacteria bacterium RYN_339]
MLKRLALILSLSAMMFTSGTLPSMANGIYEPDSPYDAAPNALLESLPKGTEVKAKVIPGGAELVAENPQYANAVVTIDKNGVVRADVYVRVQRVLSFVGDDGSRANQFAEALNRVYTKGGLRPDQITPGRRNNQYVILAGKEAILTIDDKLAAAQGSKPAQLALGWIDNVRTAMGGVPFAQQASRGGMFLSGSRIGHASWYGPGFNGRRSASGERFDQNMMTAAHKTLPFGTLLLVTNLTTKRSCIVRINDRGPYVAGREIDLSAAAARSIGVGGVATVRIDILKP